METKTHSFFDRVAIAFGAMVLGFSAGLVVAIPLLAIIGVVSSDLSNIGTLLFWKVPILLGLVSGVVGFFAPKSAADGLGKIWIGVLFIWRFFRGS